MNYSVEGSRNGRERERDGQQVKKNKRGGKLVDGYAYFS